MSDTRAVAAALNELKGVLADLRKDIRNSGGAAPGGQYSPRVSRGGKLPSDTGSMSDLKKELRESKNALKDFAIGMAEAIPMAKLFKDKLKEATDELRKSSAAQDKVTQKVIDAAEKSVRQNGILSTTTARQIRKMKELAELTDKVNRLTQIKTELDRKKMQLEEENARLESLREQHRRNRKDKAVKSELEETNKRVKMLSDEIAAGDKLIEANEGLVEEFKTLIATVGVGDTALTGLTDSVKSSLKAFDLNNASMRDHGEALQTIKKNTESFGATMDHVASRLANAAKNFNDSVQEATQAFGRDITAFVRSGGGGILQNYMAQLRNNVFESNYVAAGLTGMSDAQMSALLGEYGMEARVMGGTTSRGDVVDSGTFRDLHIQARNMGLIGEEAGRMVMQMARMSIAGGLGTSPDAIGKSMDAVQMLSESLGTTVQDAANIYESLSRSGVMAGLSMRYQQLSPEDRQDAIRSEIDARYRNARLLGQTNEELEEQLRMQQAQKYGTVSEQIRGMIGARMAVSRARQSGIDISDEGEQALVSSLAFGVGSAEGDRVLQQIRGAHADLRNRGARESAALGGPSGTGMQGAVEKAILDSIDSRILANMQSAEQASVRRQEMGTEGALLSTEFRSHSILAANQMEKLPTNLENFNTSLMLLDEHIPGVLNAMRGISENPILGGLGNTLGGLFNMIGAGLVYRGMMANTRGTGGVGGGLLARARGAASSAWGATKSIASRGAGLVKRDRRVRGVLALGTVAGLGMGLSGSAEAADGATPSEPSSGQPPSAGRTLASAGVGILAGMKAGAMVGGAGGLIGGPLGVAAGVLVGGVVGAVASSMTEKVYDAVVPPVRDTLSSTLESTEKDTAGDDVSSVENTQGIPEWQRQIREITDHLNDIRKDTRDSKELQELEFSRVYSVDEITKALQTRSNQLDARRNATTRAFSQA